MFRSVQKPKKHIDGILAVPPVVGECAFIQTANGPMRTSEVSAVLSYGSNYYIETQNTCYWVHS